MFGVLSSSLGVRMSLSVEGAGHMPRRCVATTLESEQAAVQVLLFLERFCHVF